MRKTSVERKIITVKMLILVSCIIMGFLCLKIWNINFKKAETVANNKIYKVYVETGFDTSTYIFSTSKVFPTKGYVLNTSLTTCTGGGTISQDKNIINAIFNSSDSCKLYFDAKKPILYGLAVNTILNIVGDADDTSTAVIEDTELAYDGTSDKNLRYVGYESTNNNLNNYIDIGDASSLWRIIGVFNNIDDGTGKKETRLKIMRAESLGGYSWDTSASNINLGKGVNQWGPSGSYEGADLMRELNGDYLNTTLSSNTTWYNDYGNHRTKIYYRSNSLSLSAQALIGDAVWYTGAVSDDNLISNVAYDYYQSERGTLTSKSCSSSEYCNDSVTRTATWVGKIALPYVSDFAYAVGDTDRDRCLDISLYNWGDRNNDNYCEKYSWLILSTDNDDGPTPVFLNPVSISNSASNVMHLHIYNYYFSMKDASNSINVILPTAFLKSNVEITGGTGAIDDPYIAALP